MVAAAGRSRRLLYFELGYGGDSGDHGDGGGVGRDSDDVDEALRRRGQRGAGDVVDNGRARCRGR